MNNVKFYRKNKAGGLEILAVRVRQNPPRFSVDCPWRYRKARMGVAQMTAMMEKQGWTRTRLYLTPESK